MKKYQEKKAQWQNFFKKQGKKEKRKWRKINFREPLFEMFPKEKK